METNNEIAVIGMNCNFPGANTIDKFWELLKDAKCAISKAPDSRKTLAALFKKASGTEQELFGGFVDEFNYFDEQFFNISPRESKYLDPQQRLLLQLVWHALEDAYLDPASLFNSNTGVYMGIMGSEWSHLSFHQLNAIDRYTGAGNGYCLTANRISYHYGLQGPSYAIDTACSSSLVAVDSAAKALIRHDINLAIVGGINLMLTPGLSLFYMQAGLMSKNGCSKPFSNEADGIGRGEGGGVVILKRLSDAVADGDRIYAVISGSATNHNGQSNGIMAPSKHSQINLLSHLYESMQLDVNNISYIEAHGTGTLIGDPIEAAALSEVIGKHRNMNNPCKIGSVKGNIGHLEGAAGIAGFIKAVLCIYHRSVVPNLHCKVANKYINFHNNGLSIQKNFELLDPTQKLNYIGVNSFGLGGTNAHVVLRNFPNVEISENSHHDAIQILKLSVKTPKKLNNLAISTLEHIMKIEDRDFPDFCALTNLVKTDFRCRLAFVGTRNQIIENLKNHLLGESPRTFKNDNDDSSLITTQKKYLNSESVNWFDIYSKPKKHIKLPSYPFTKNYYDLDKPLRDLFSILTISPNMDANIIDESSTHERPENKIINDKLKYINYVLIDEIGRASEIPIERLSENTSLDSDIGLDSLMLVDIKTAICKKIPSALNLTFDHISHAKNINDLAKLILQFEV